jgi:hypothetical protein
MTTPNLESFRKLAQNRRVIPVFRKLLAMAKLHWVFIENLLMNVLELSYLNQLNTEDLGRVIHSLG